MADHYEVLGVAKNAPVDEIRRVYKTLARDRHPDRFTDPAEKAKAQVFFQELTEAFNTLSNEFVIMTIATAAIARLLVDQQRQSYAGVAGRAPNTGLRPAAGR